MLYLYIMEKYFTMENGSRCNIIEHTKEQIAAKDGLKVYIGTDSQVHKKIIAIATVIVYRYGTNGAHYVYDMITVPRKKMSHYERLFEEGSRTISTAQLLKEQIPSLSIEALEFDYNDVKKTISSPLISIFRGWAMGIGFKPLFKAGKDSPMISTKAGDHICRKKLE
jgi:predicted RNase H-related nuclease YkuK (DUF458 family)